MSLINGFILSAGLGERLSPITEDIPKPLLPILGRPLIEIILERLSHLPINRIGINLYHKGEEIEGWIRRSAFKEKIETFYEESLLGTGGALKNAEGFLKDRPFIVHNSDIISDIDLGRLIDHHLSSRNIVTLAVHNYPEFNNVVIDEDGAFIGVRSLDFRGCGQNSKMIAFTGIAVYSPLFLRFLPEGRSSVIEGWLKAVASGYTIRTVDVTGSYWRDIGTPESYYNAIIDILKRDGESIYIHPEAEVREDGWFEGYVVIEDRCKIDKAVRIKDTILMPGTEIKSNSEHEDSIIGPDYYIKFDTPPHGKTPIGRGGSDRDYYRVKRGDKSSVLMEFHKESPDFERHIEYSRFFKRYSIPVPELIEVDHVRKRAEFEDLGDLSLYGWLKGPRNKGDIEEVYRRAVDLMILIHSTLIDHLSECPPLKEMVFDYEHLIWESDYFIERFVKAIRNMEVDNISSLKDEFQRLALKVDSFPKTVIHRDFQSQNIMIQKGGSLRIVDYQGARIGPPAYDLVSLLWDPYFRLRDSMRERLIDYYIEGRERVGGEGFNGEDFRKTILPCRLQRHMQALGAYGFLSTVKGKRYFLKYVPEGLRLLKEDVSLTKDDYPELYRLVSKL